MDLWCSDATHLSTAKLGVWYMVLRYCDKHVTLAARRSSNSHAQGRPVTLPSQLLSEPVYIHRKSLKRLVTDSFLHQGTVEHTIHGLMQNNRRQ